MTFLRAALTALLIALAATASGTTYSVSDVPNVHLADRTRFTTNPDGVLSNEAVAALDAMIGALRDSLTVEPVVVAIDDIDTDDVDAFATELFQSWGLGKNDLDNGLLLLIVRDRHTIVLRTGQGMEGVLPDVACGRIIRDVMRPAFRENDYDGGTLKAMQLIGSVIRDPANAGELISGERDADSRGGAHIDDDFTFDRLLKIMGTCGVVATIVLLLLLLSAIRKRSRRSPSEQWNHLMILRTVALFAAFLGIAIPLLAYIPIAITMRRMRSRHDKCPNCGEKMHKLDEETDNLYLSHGQDMEERLKSVDYDVWLCDRCGTTDVIPYVNSSSGFSVCPICGAKACTLTRDTVTRKPTTMSEGLGIKTYTCFNCHHNDNRKYTIAKLAAAAPVIIGGFGGGGGGSIGGGFGGGGTMGGGASGGW